MEGANQKKVFITRDKNFYSTLIKLAIPMGLQYLITFLVGFADNVMIGRLGDAAISGVYMGNQIQTIVQLFSGGVEGAILILAAQYWGKKDTKSIKKIIAVGVKFAVLFGVLLTLGAVTFTNPILRFLTNDDSVVREGVVYLKIVGISYIFFCISQVFIASMRAVETAKIGLYISIMTLVVNVGLNYVFIFGVGTLIPKMGVAGAALATLISRILEAVVAVFYTLFVDKKLCLKLRELIPTDKTMLGDFVRYGLPVIGGNVIWGVNMIGQSVILGRFDAAVISAASITGSLNNLIYVWMNGISQSIGIITGKTVGAGEYEKMKEYARTTQIIFLVVGVLSGIAVFFLKMPFISLYSVTSDAVNYSVQFCNVLSVTIVGTCYQAASLFGLVKSGGDISFVFINDTIFVLLVVLPSAFIAWKMGTPAWVVFACLKCDQILKCIVAFFKIKSYNWMKNLTRDNA